MQIPSSMLGKWGNSHIAREALFFLLGFQQEVSPFPGKSAKSIEMLQGQPLSVSRAVFLKDLSIKPLRYLLNTPRKRKLWLEKMWETQFSRLVCGHVWGRGTFLTNDPCGRPSPLWALPS